MQIQHARLSTQELQTYVAALRHPHFQPLLLRLLRHKRTARPVQYIMQTRMRCPKSITSRHTRTRTHTHTDRHTHTHTPRQRQTDRHTHTHTKKKRKRNKEQTQTDTHTHTEVTIKGHCVDHAAPLPSPLGS